MEHRVLNVEPRTTTKKSAARRLRKNGQIPAIIYGSHEPEMVQVDGHFFKTKMYPISESTIIDLKSGKKTWEVLVKDVQYEVLTGEIYHIDFFELTKGKLLKTHVPVHVTGNSPGVREGGLLEHSLHEVEIECLPKDLPDHISVDISELQIGDALHVSEMTLAPGIKILNSPEAVVAQVVNVKKVALDEEAAADEAAPSSEAAE